MWISVRSLPSGEPRRLTSDAVFEFDPSWAPDGRSLVYAT